MSKSESSSAEQLLLLTHAYPYGKTTEFLEAEIEYLTSAFAEVVVAPAFPLTKEPDPTPPNVSVDLSLAPLLTRPCRTKAAFRSASLAFGNAPNDNWMSARPRSAARLWLATGRAESTRGWLAERRPALSASLVAYSFWLNAGVIGIRRAWSELPVVSRAHGGDLFAEADPSGVLPLQRAMIDACDEVFSVSDRGSHYLRKRYPHASSKIQTARLGIRPMPPAQTSADGRLHILTCSFLSKVKRPFLAADAIRCLASTEKVVWDHFGDGPLQTHLIEKMRPLAPAVDFRFHGLVPNDTIRRHFSTQPVDLFLNTSVSEGVPISILEAQSAGVPVIATDVGGTREAVEGAGGQLVPSNATDSEIAAAMRAVLSRDDDRSLRRDWTNKHFGERSVYAPFAHHLAQLSK